MESLREYLKSERGAKLETISYYNNINNPCIIFAVGVGGTAGKGSSADNLTRSFVDLGYKVRIFSPRNSGGSTGNITVDNYVSDLELAIRNSEYLDERKPFVIGHSIGGYALGRILFNNADVEKAVLLSPLLNITEQNPGFLKNSFGRKFVSYILSLTGLDAQKFSDRKDAYSFLESLYFAEECKEKMNVPTYIILTGRTNIGFKIKNLNELEKKWKELQTKSSKIETYSDLDHFFSGLKLLGGKKFFLAKETEEIIKKIDSFFRD